MKKLFFLMAIIAIFIASCAKEKIDKQSGTSDQTIQSDIRLVTLNNGTKGSFTMLEFKSIEIMKLQSKS